MKHVFFLLSMTLLCFSCTQQECEVKTAGFVTAFPDATYTMGTNESVAVWQKYIELHNQKDLEGIMAMTWDSIQIYGPNGEYINGKAEHRAFLEEWFSSDIGLSWSFTWATAVKVVDAPGEWVLSGIDFVQSDSTVSVESQIISAAVGPEKVYEFYVKTSKVPQAEPEEEK